jgi:hypothetical protein
MIPPLSAKRSPAHDFYGLTGARVTTLYVKQGTYNEEPTSRPGRHGLEEHVIRTYPDTVTVRGAGNTGRVHHR